MPSCAPIFTRGSRPRASGRRNLFMTGRALRASGLRLRKRKSAGLKCDPLSSEISLETLSALLERVQPVAGLFKVGINLHRLLKMDSGLTEISRGLVGARESELCVG